MMQPEIEAKFINVDHDDIRAKLRKIGGQCEQPMRLMRRVVFHNPHMTEKKGFVRVRDEGHRVTVTYKQYDDGKSIHGVQEIETTAANFETMVKILEQTGLDHQVYRETKRETWRLGEVEVVLDLWPWVNPYIEIEGPSEQHVKATAKKLGFKWSDAVIGGPAAVYSRQYPAIKDRAIPLINHEISMMRFEDPVPESFGKSI